MLRLENPSGVLATTKTPGGPLVQTVHDARAHRVAESLVTEVTHLGIEGQQTGHQRAVAVTRAGVHDLARCLVDDGEVLVVQDDVDLDAGVGLDVGALGSRKYRDQVLALTYRRRRLHDDLVVQRDRAAEVMMSLVSERDRPVNSARTRSRRISSSVLGTMRSRTSPSKASRTSSSLTRAAARPSGPRRAT